MGSISNGASTLMLSYVTFGDSQAIRHMLAAMARQVFLNVIMIIFLILVYLQMLWHKYKKKNGRNEAGEQKSQKRGKE
jgi:hypothetical protein